MSGCEASRVAVTVGIVITLLFAACGGGGSAGLRGSPSGTSGAGPSPTAPSTSPLGEGTTALLIEAGATEEEARCIDTATADAPVPDADDAESMSRAAAEQITSLAGECASHTRLEEIAARVGVLLEEELANVVEPFVKQLAAAYEAAGAQPDEARCVAEVLLSQGRSLSSRGNAEARADAIAEVLAREGQHCAAPPRLRKLTLNVFVSPLVSTLEDGGATQTEATCIVHKTESIEIFLPSEDFNGPDSAEMAGDRFVENASGCAPPDRLRKIVRTVFKQYIEGCSKSSEDPMAPYDC